MSAAVGRRRGRQPFGCIAPPRHSAGHRQPQDLRPRSASRRRGCSTAPAAAWTLTDAGRAYIAACAAHPRRCRRGRARGSGRIQRAPTGDLIITAPIVFGRLHVLPAVIEFIKVYPEVDVRLVLNDRVVSLAEDHVDLAVRIGEMPDSSLVALRVGSISRIVCASPTYLEGARPAAPSGRPRRP